MNSSKFLKRFITGTVFFLISFFIFDFALYSLFYKQYDKINKIGRIKKRADILIVGSSNIFWGVNKTGIALSTGLSTHMMAIAGGDVEFRYEIAREYLERHKNNPPRLIIFHADRHMFSQKRYSALAYLPLQGYYHKGILKQYIHGRWNLPSGPSADELDKTKSDKEKFNARMDRHSKDLRRKYLNKISRSYTINSEFYFVGAKIYDTFASPLKQLGRIVGLDMGGPPALPTLPAGPAPEKKNETPKTDSKKEPKKFEIEGITDFKNDQEKIKAWRKLYADMNKAVIIDPKQKAAFEKAADLFDQAKVPVIFLETPVFKLFDSDAPYEPVRDIIRARNSEYNQYLRLDPKKMEENLSYYFDASHLNPTTGGLAYTKLLVEAIKKRLAPK